MATQIQLRQGTTTEHNTFKGAVGEVTVDTTKDTLVVHDGVTVGGHPVAARANADGTISLIKKDGTSAGTINAVGLFNNTLTSTNTNQALTAAQGKVLKDTLDNTVVSSFGVGQTWQDVTGSRSSGVTYTNNTGKPIMISVIATGRDATVTIYVGSVLVASQTDIYDSYANISTGSTIVPAGATYRVISTNKYGVSMTSWAELR